MYKKIVAAGLVIFFTMITVASASVRPSFTEPVYGLDPCVWLAIVVGVFAFIDNIGEFTLKKKEDSTISYDYAYLKTTILIVAVMCTGVLLTPVVELTELAILNAIILGLGGNEYVARKTKVVKRVPADTVGDTNE